MKASARHLAAGLFVMLVAGIALAASTVSFFATDRKNAYYDLDQPVPADALLFKGYSDTPYTDSLFYQFDGEDGLDFFCHFILADMGYGMKKFILDYKLHYPDGECVYYGRKFDDDEGALSSQRLEWNIGPNHVTGDQSSQTIHIESGPLVVDVVMKKVVPFYRVNQGMLYVEPERKKQACFTYFPLFEASGTIKHGNTVTRVSGWGCGNRVYENFLINDISTLHTALRWHRDGIGFDLHDYVMLPEYGGQWLPILMVYQDGKMIDVDQDFEKKNLGYITEEKTGQKIPAGYRIKSQRDGMTVTIEFTDVRLSDYNDPLIALTPVEKYLLTLVVESPLDLRFDGQVRLEIKTPDGQVLTRQGPGHGLALISKE